MKVFVCFLVFLGVFWCFLVFPPTRCLHHGRLAAHLGLRTPHGASMAVGEHELSWEEGKATVFDVAQHKWSKCLT